MKDKNQVGRPLLGKARRIPLSALVEPSTIDLLDSWGPSRGICIDRLVEAHKAKLDYDSEG